ncbi:MAG: zinc ribbon domain-containing protein, partial [Thermoanaerobaculia bacterium]
MIPARAVMKECPYCYAPVQPLDTVCPKCGRQIERWQTGFYS